MQSDAVQQSLLAGIEADGLCRETREVVRALADTGNVNDHSTNFVFDFLHENFRIPGIVEMAFFLPDKVEHWHAMIIVAVRYVRSVVVEIPLAIQRHGGRLADSWCRLAKYVELSVSFLDHVIAKWDSHNDMDREDTKDLEEVEGTVAMLYGERDGRKYKEQRKVNRTHTTGSLG